MREKYQSITQPTAGFCAQNADTSWRGRPRQQRETAAETNKVKPLKR